MNKALLSNHSNCESKRVLLEQELQKCQREKEAQIADLQDQIRDLMIHMDSQHTVANSILKDEIVDATISIPQPTEPESSKKNRRKKKWTSFSCKNDTEIYFMLALVWLKFFLESA